VSACVRVCVCVCEFDVKNGRVCMAKRESEALKGRGEKRARR